MHTTSGSNWDRARIARVAALAVAGVTLLSLVGWAVFGMVTPESCSVAEIDGVRSFGLISAAIAGFVAGHILGRWFESSPAARPHHQVARPTARVVRLSGALLVQTALVLFLALSMALLAYETLALADIHRNWPITFFVRCFTHANLVWTAIGSAAFCFLLGHWVWYPAGDERG